jgi:hypothetical protein
LNSEGFRETFSEERQKGPKKAKMAGKKEAKQKAGTRGQTEKNREEAESSAGTKNTSEEGGQSVAHRKQPQAMREQGKQRPEEGAQGQRKIEGKDIQEGWETIKEIYSAGSPGREAGQSNSSNLPEPSSGRGCCCSCVWRPARSFLQKKTRRNGIPREESVKIPRPPQGCWTKKRKKMHNG